MVILGVAVDRLGNPVSRWVTRRIFAAAEFIALRDELSLPYVDHVPPDRVRLSADLVFGLDFGPADITTARPRPVIGLCFIDYYRTVEPSAAGHRAYVDAIRGLVARNRHRYDFACIAFQSGIGQRDDWLFGLLCGHSAECRPMRVDSPASAAELAKAVDIFVTTRFHLGVLGVIWRKPVVVIDHELKMRALAEEFGIPAVTLQDFISGKSLEVPELVHSYPHDRIADRCRAARERAARNFDWLDGTKVLTSRSG